MFKWWYVKSNQKVYWHKQVYCEHKKEQNNNNNNALLLVHIPTVGPPKFNIIISDIN